MVRTIIDHNLREHMLTFFRGNYEPYVRTNRSGGVSRSASGQKFSWCFHGGVKTGARTPAETVQVGVFTVSTQGPTVFTVSVSSD